MRARFALVLVLAALLAGGCGESDSGASEKAAAPKAARTPDSKNSGPGAY